jgi:uncharacterized lipoprotein YddW (UPF0748 family)
MSLLTSIGCYLFSMAMVKGWIRQVAGFAFLFFLIPAICHSQPVPPPVPREARAVWVASVGNIDWPSKQELTVSEQKAELVAIFQKASQLKLNVVILQVRPACDALYESKLEPWSNYLTGQMGKAPEPFYDPLAMAVEEAHRRGIELHAWFNPYRARHTSAKGEVARSHISKTHPEWVKTYGKQLWLDPGEKEVQRYSTRVIMDVVNRYDIDGVHIDDYFYPYPEYDSNRQPIDFPDWASWKKYREKGGQLSRDDWRRDNVNQFVSGVHQAIKKSKPWVKFGISPFGIWRPGSPAVVRGLDSYSLLYADSKKWWNQGWCDYLVPQLYWAMEAKEQPFVPLLNWWAEQNLQGGQLWAGMNRTTGDEMGKQIQASRNKGAGQAFWSYKVVAKAQFGIDQALSASYLVPALVPAMQTPKAISPAPPIIESRPVGNGVRVNWSSSKNQFAWQWIVQIQHNGAWETQIASANQTETIVPANLGTVIAVTAINRYGQASPPNVVELFKPVPKKP